MHLDQGEVAVRYNPRFRGYGIRILDGGSSVQTLYFCPWCGGKLPDADALTDKWFKILEEMLPEFDGFADTRTPDEFKSDEWWKKRGL